MARIAIVDYGMGNLRSVEQALRHAAPEHDVVVTSDAKVIDAADRVVFPGQGAMPDCMRFLQEAGLVDAVMRAASSRPLLGICVGEQMLFDFSDEGGVPGLGLFAGRVERFPQAAMQLPDGSHLKVPHMGWNRVWQPQRDTRPHPCFEGVDDGDWFYFVHSYFVCPQDRDLSVGESDYGVRFTCAVARNNIFATQFHPEKSADSGLRIFRNFTRWNP